MITGRQWRPRHYDEYQDLAGFKTRAPVVSAPDVARHCSFAVSVAFDAPDKQPHWHCSPRFGQIIGYRRQRPPAVAAYRSCWWSAITTPTQAASHEPRRISYRDLRPEVGKLRIYLKVRNASSQREDVKRSNCVAECCSRGRRVIFRWQPTATRRPRYCASRVAGAGTHRSSIALEQNVASSFAPMTMVEVRQPGNIVPVKCNTSARHAVAVGGRGAGHNAG